MREILFKAKRIDNGQWVEGFYFCMVHDDGRHVHHFIMPLGADLNLGTPIEKIQVEVDVKTICQYTGLTDNNGNKIWENDIIEVKNKKHHFISQIEWDDCSKGFMFQDSKTSWCGLDAFTSGGIYRFGCEVIGNIFDNADLVKE